MAEINLTQADADALIAMPKHKLNDDPWDYPGEGGSISVPLISADKREAFSLDVYRGRIDLLKGTYQKRARHVVVLVRLDFGNQPHRNPDGDKWAMPVPVERFPNLGDLWQTLENFMEYCNITEPPAIRRGLFT